MDIEPNEDDLISRDDDLPFVDTCVSRHLIS